MLLLLRVAVAVETVAAGGGGAGADEAVGQEEEVAVVGDLDEETAGSVDVLRVAVVRDAPGVGDFDVGGEGGAGFEVEDEVEAPEEGFLVVVPVWRGGLGEGGWGG